MVDPFSLCPRWVWGGIWGPSRSSWICLCLQTSPRPSPAPRPAAGWPWEPSSSSSSCSVRPEGPAGDTSAHLLPFHHHGADVRTRIPKSSRHGKPQPREGTESRNCSVPGSFGNPPVPHPKICTETKSEPVLGFPGILGGVLLFFGMASKGGAFGAACDFGFPKSLFIH